MTAMSIEPAGHTSLQLDMLPDLPLNRVSIPFLQHKHPYCLH